MHTEISPEGGAAAADKGHRAALINSQLIRELITAEYSSVSDRLSTTLPPSGIEITPDDLVDLVTSDSYLPHPTPRHLLICILKSEIVSRLNIRVV